MSRCPAAINSVMRRSFGCRLSFADRFKSFPTQPYICENASNKVTMFGSDKLGATQRSKTSSVGRRQPVYLVILSATRTLNLSTANVLIEFSDRHGVVCRFYSCYIPEAVYTTQQETGDNELLYLRLVLRLLLVAITTTATYVFCRQSATITKRQRVGENSAKGFFRRASI